MISIDIWGFYQNWQIGSNCHIYRLMKCLSVENYPNILDNKFLPDNAMHAQNITWHHMTCVSVEMSGCLKTKHPKKITKCVLESSVANHYSFRVRWHSPQKVCGIGIFRKSFAASTEARQQPCVFQLSHKGRPGWRVMLPLAVNFGRFILVVWKSEQLWEILLASHQRSSYELGRTPTLREELQ